MVVLLAKLFYRESVFDVSVRFIVFISLLLHSVLCNAQNNGVVINRPLTWSDFKGRGTDGSPVKAKTFTYMGYSSKVKNGKFSYKVTCYFIPKQSWVSRGYLKQCSKAESAYLLKHEQGHYDIARIIAREADAALAKLKRADKRTIKQARSTFMRYVNKLKTVQARYDRDTRHSLNNAGQSRWNAKIEKGLRQGYIE